MLKLMNYKLLVNDNLKEFTVTNRERLTGNCIFLEFVPFIYIILGKKENLKM